MEAAQFAHYKQGKQPYLIAFAAALLLVAALAGKPFIARAATGGPQECTTGTNCLIGEFLFDDSSTPIATATCTITSRNPSGNLYINGASMTAASDGWYSYSFTAPATTGDYRTQVCCNFQSDDLCIDKTFRVTQESSVDNGAIASAVWGYSSRTLTSFGDLVSNIWSSSSRTLTNLITSSSQSDKTSDAVDLSDLSDIRRTVRENRLLLEKLANAPIIETFVEDEETPDLQSKIKETKSVAGGLYTNSQFLKSKTNLLTKKWYLAGNTELIDSVMELNGLLGEESDVNSANSVFGQINYLKKNWDWDEAGAAYERAKLIKKALNSVQRSLGTGSRGRYAYFELQGIGKSLSYLEQIIGDSSNFSSQKTIYARVRQVEELAKAYDDQLGEVDKLLASFARDKDRDVGVKAEALLKKVLALNKVPRVSKALEPDTTKSAEVQFENKLYGIRGIIDSNKKLLAKAPGKALANTWLEVGSIVFKSLVTNPSTLIAQEVPLKYYLPQEVREEHIIKTSDGLRVGYDTERDQYYTEGTYTLAAGETRTFTVSVEDIWVISEAEIESLRTQAAELFRPLEKTSYFGQGVTIKSDIDVSLDKAKALIEDGITPEARIRAHREAQIEIASVKEKISKLEELVALASSAGSFFGFVGSAQTLAVWGLIIIMVTGFVFLVIYMRTLGASQAKVKAKAKIKEKGEKGFEIGKQNGKTGNGEHVRPKLKPGAFIRTAMPFVFVAVVSAAISGGIATAFALRSVNKDKSPEEELVQAPPEEKEEVLAEKDEAENDEESPEEGLGGELIVRVVVPSGAKVNLREEPSLDGLVIARFDKTTEVIKIGEIESWVNVVYQDVSTLEATTESLAEPLEGWVYKDYVDEPEVGFSADYYNYTGSSGLDYTPGNTKSNSLTGNVVVIGETSTGWLRVRKTPQGAEIGKVNPGEIYGFLEKSGSWLKIELRDGKVGWVSSQYASVE